MSEILRVGIAGLGTVGRAVIQILRDKENSLYYQSGKIIKVIAVSARDSKKDRGINLKNFQWYDDPVSLAGSENIDVFVELIGGGEGSAYQSVKKALNSKHHVVTANKALLSRFGIELSEISEKNNVFLNFEGAVAGGIPIIKVLKESLSGNTVFRIYGILNGTCNYILTKMEEENFSFEESLQEAKKLGYAESDSTFDIDGYDTAHKLNLMTMLAFKKNAPLKDVKINGIKNISLEDISAAKDLGYRIKLLGIAISNKNIIEQYVQPTVLPESSIIAQIKGITNAVVVETDLLGNLVLCGSGAGGSATASSVINDIIDIARFQSNIHPKTVFGVPSKVLQSYNKDIIFDNKSEYFVRMNVCDRIGVFASVANHIAKNNISLESIIQKTVPSKESKKIKMQEIIFITYKTKENLLRKALSEIVKENILISNPKMIKIERPL